MCDILSKGALRGRRTGATRRPPHAILFAVVWAAVSAASVTADTLPFELGPADITVSSIFGTLTDIDSDVLEPTDPTLIGALVQPDLFFRFPTSPSSLPAGFVSAAFSGERKGGVGTSGVVIDPGVPPSAGSARATYTQAIINLSDEPLEILLTYLIPRLEATIFPGSVLGVSNVQAFAAARLNATVLDVDRTEVSRDRIFTYELGQAPPPLPGEEGVFRSADLVDEQGDGFLISEAGVRGVEYGPFEGTRTLPTIPFGGVLILEYQFEAGGSTISREHGYQAFVGDPFDLSAGGGFDITVADGAAVPEPATILLTPGALVGLLIARRRRRSKALQGRARCSASA